MPKVSKSDWQQSVYVASDSPISGGMTVHQLLNFAKELERQEIGIYERIECHHDHDTRHLTHLSVRETRKLEEAAEASEPA